MKNNNPEPLIDLLINLNGIMLVITLVLCGLCFLIIAYRVYKCPISWETEYKGKVMHLSRLLLLFISGTIAFHTCYELDKSDNNAPSSIESKSSTDNQITKKRQDL
ncbi:hypothetical protein CBK19_22930 [Salmonella enterica subsp. enterica serovar Hillingdon]|nr:hypothetical protein [Salmonella enterica subsp. enterica serovar Hillingdon]